MELEGKDLDLNQSAASLLDRLVQFDVGAEQNLLNHHTHCLEPEVELALLEQFLLASVTASLQKSEEGLTDGQQILKVPFAELMEYSEWRAVLSKHVQT